jgi:hypothetical protein
MTQPSESLKIETMIQDDYPHQLKEKRTASTEEKVKLIEEDWGKLNFTVPFTKSEFEYSLMLMDMELMYMIVRNGNFFRRDPRRVAELFADQLAIEFYKLIEGSDFKRNYNVPMVSLENAKGEKTPVIVKATLRPDKYSFNPGKEKGLLILVKCIWETHVDDEEIFRFKYNVVLINYNDTKPINTTRVIEALENKNAVCLLGEFDNSKSDEEWVKTQLPLFRNISCPDTRKLFFDYETNWLLAPYKKYVEYLESKKTK